jgi:hypothetical protein
VGLAIPPYGRCQLPGEFGSPSTERSRRPSCGDSDDADGNCHVRKMGRRHGSPRRSGGPNGYAGYFVGDAIGDAINDAIVRRYGQNAGGALFDILNPGVTFGPIQVCPRK